MVLDCGRLGRHISCGLTDMAGLYRTLFLSFSIVALILYILMQSLLFLFISYAISAGHTHTSSRAFNAHCSWLVSLQGNKMNTKIYALLSGCVFVGEIFSIFLIYFRVAMVVAISFCCWTKGPPHVEAIASATVGGLHYCDIISLLIICQSGPYGTSKSSGLVFYR